MVCYSLPLATYLCFIYSFFIIILFYFLTYAYPQSLVTANQIYRQLFMCLSVHVNLVHKFTTKLFCAYEF